MFDFSVRTSRFFIVKKIFFPFKLTPDYQVIRILSGVIMKKAIRNFEIGLLGFVALSAIPSGIIMMVFPQGDPMNMPLSMLEGSPFKSFFWPGIMLCGIIGLSHAIALFMGLKSRPLSGSAAAVAGLGLIIWLYVQVSMIGGGHWLQILYFAVAIAEVTLAVLLLRE